MRDEDGIAPAGGRRAGDCAWSLASQLTGLPMLSIAVYVEMDTLPVDGYFFQQPDRHLNADINAQSASRSSTDRWPIAFPWASFCAVLDGELQPAGLALDTCANGDQARLLNADDIGSSG